MSTPIYPLLLRPEFHERVWGGRRLAEVLGAGPRKLMPEGNIGESWSMGTDSKVLNGPLSGQKLGEAAAAHAAAMLGGAALGIVQESESAYLPLLFKILDAQATLSIQVHPDDDYARRVEHVPLGKTEAWYCLDAAPGAYVIHGFKRPVTPEEVRSGLEDGSIVQVLRKVELRKGDTIHVPAGVVHAIGGGLLLGEIQENSDITYRLYDWGRAREMHVKRGLEVLDLDPPGFGVSSPLEVREGESTVRYLVACRYFLYQELQVRGRLNLDTGGRSFHCLFCFEGRGELRYREEGGGQGALAFGPGQTVFVPAALGEYTLVGESCRLLRSFVPDLREDILSPLLRAGYNRDAINALGGAPGNELEQSSG